MDTKNINVVDEPEYRSIIIGKLMNISGILQRETNRLLAPYQLNQQQFSILFEIAKAKEVQQKDMVNRLMLEKAHVSKVVKKLQIMGLVDVVPIPEDKRSSLLKPTATGKKLVGKCRVVFRKWNKECLEQFNSKELDQILNSVDRLQKAFLSKYAKQTEDRA
jgi:DNA-binding MarR family transcriptional regulator